MKSVFVDSFYFFALVNPKDPAHGKAAKFTAEFKGQFVTTGWVLTETGDGFAKPLHWRAVFLQILTDLRARSNTTIEPMSDELMRDGLDLFARRPDKEWSLTDCISFVVMAREGIIDALTGDHHFE